MAFIHIPKQLSHQLGLQPGQTPEHTIEAGNLFDLQDIPFSEVEYYGWDHAQQVSKLSALIAQVQFGMEGADLQAVTLAGLYHDLGRTTPWQQADPYHNKRSAELAVRYMTGAGKFQTDSALVEKVERLILLHDLSAAELPRDPMQQALWDADSYDAARIRPGSVDGLKLFKARTRPERLCTEWAKDPANKRTWLSHRGWK